jgi:S-adenosylmethionine hydrolase
VVTLLTDFGLNDPFVGIMKGVMLRLAPGLELIDLSHGIPAQDVEAASFTLAHSFSWFAPNTVHLCVVDPGVGSARAAVAVRARGHTFVGPDNGVFGAVAKGDPSAAARRIEPSGLGLQLRSRTFHGRDLFAPVAALLAAGMRRFEELGPLHELAPGFSQRPQPSDAGCTGKVVLVDHFGNLISDVPGAALSAGCKVELGARRLRSVGTYSEAEPGECVALVSSFDTLEIAERDGSAARTLGVGRGEPVRVVSGEG